MLLLKALRYRSIQLIWSGQVLSAIGDEIYRVAFIWLAVGLIGPDTGYLAATQSLALVLVSLFGGKWADQWNHSRTLLRVDLVRGVLILIPVAYAMIWSLSLPVLWACTVLISGLGGFFEPSLQAELPRYCENRLILQAANGLMSTTLRVARVAAPVIIASLTAFIPTIHFFTLDSLTFFISAYSIYLLQKQPSQPAHVSTNEKQSIVRSLMLTIETVKRVPLVFRALMIKNIAGGLWQLAYGLGFALLVQQRVAHDVKAFGAVMGAYGIGNLSAAIGFGSRERKNPEALVYLGHVWLGLGFIGVALSPTLPLMMACAAFAAIGGPMNDTPFIDLIQMHYPPHELPRIVRLRQAVETGCGLLALLASPFLFRWTSVPIVVAICGASILVLGVYGYIKRETK